MRVAGFPQYDPVGAVEVGEHQDVEQSARGARPSASRRSRSRRSSLSGRMPAEDYASPVGGKACPNGSRSETPTVAAAWVPLSGEGNDVEAKGFALQITGSHLLVRLCLLRSPLDKSLPPGLRLGSVSIRQRCQGVPHRPPNCFAFIMPKAKLTLESISECTKGMPHH